ncbi:DUF3014 domain-containing protein [Myxococcaceae bacterium GXIMD 01537]
MTEQPKTPNRTPLIILSVAGLATLGGVGAWYALRNGGEATAPAQPGMVVAPQQPAAPPAAPPEDSGPAPSVAQGDARVRELAGGLSAEPEYSKWLGSEGLIQRFTTAVSNIADGESPRMVLAFLAPAQGFQVTQGADGTVIDSHSYERYEPVARVFGSMDVEKTARVYGELKPLINRAYAEIAPPGQTFDGTLARAMEHLLAVPMPQGEQAVTERGALYVFADPSIEGLSRAQKQMLRMGPANAQRIQTKLRELKGALNLPRAGR